MEFGGLVLVIFLTFGIFFAASLGAFLRSKCKKSSATTKPAPVVVTSATHTAPGGYPVTQVPPPGGFQTNAYGAPYPANTTGYTVQMPMPMPTAGAQPPMPSLLPNIMPYPMGMPQPGAGVANMNPPTYDMAMASAPATGYEKQSAYNPNFPG